MEAFTGIGCISKNSRTACRLQQGSRRVCQVLLAEAPLASAQAPAAEVSWRLTVRQHKFSVQKVVSCCCITAYFLHETGLAFCDKSSLLAQTQEIF
eukprot:2769591-Amphidinium_carterae.1